MAYRVGISVSSFAAEDAGPMRLLEEAGVQVVPNPYGRRMTEPEIIDFLSQGLHGLVAGLEPLSRKVLETAKDLKAIARVGIGMDNVDQNAAADLGIRVSNTPDGPTEAVAEMCLAALLTLQRRLVPSSTDLHQKKWKKRIGSGLRGVKALIVGYGRIGRRVADLLRFMGVEILATDPLVGPSDLKNGERLVSLKEGIQEAEVISLHASGVQTILDARIFEIMRPGMIVLNSARGELIDEEALVKALESGVVQAAWIDVFTQEPYTGPLTGFEQTLLTPHVSTYTRQCRSSMEESAARNLLRDLFGALAP